MIVEYQQLARLPASLLEELADPRELSLADARRLQKALKRNGALERMIAALKAAPVPQSTKVQLKRALQAASDSAESGGQRANSVHCRPRLSPTIVATVSAVLTRSGAQWVCRFAADIDEQSIRHVVDRIPTLLAASRKNHWIRAYRCTDNPTPYRCPTRSLSRRHTLAQSIVRLSPHVHP